MNKFLIGMRNSGKRADRPRQKTWPIISIALLLALVVSLFFFPEISGWISITLLISSLGMALFFIIQKHIQPYKWGQTTRMKFTRNVLLDILGLLLTIAAASYFGGMAGTWAGEKAGLWLGLMAGIIIGFACAWGVRSMWMRFAPPFLK